MKTKLGSLTRIRTGKLDANAAVDGGQYPFFTCAKEPLAIASYSYDCECVLVAGNGDLNVKYYNGKFDAYQRTYIIENTSNDVLYMPYLYYFMDYYIDELRRQSIGGIIKYIRLGNLTGAEIDLPSQAEQKEIVNHLSSLSSLIDMRNDELRKLDNLVKSEFVEMFGDIRTNAYGWPIETFEELADIITDGEHATPKRQTEGIYLLSARNIKDHELDLSDVDYIGGDEYERIAKRIVPREGDVLISCSGTIGRCCVVPRGLKFQMVRSAALIRFADSINPIYAEWLITSDGVQEQIRKSATQSSQANLFQGRIKKLRGIVPPISLQQEFAAFVAQVDKSEFAVRQSIEQLEILKAKLMQEYFG